MSDYQVYSGGSLKLKGGVKEGGIVKKYVCLVYPVRFGLIHLEARKKKKAKPARDGEPLRERSASVEVLRSKGEDAKAEPSAVATSTPVSSSSPKKTEAERRFEEVQKRRVRECQTSRLLALTPA
jgi:protein FAM32A